MFKNLTTLLVCTIFSATAVLSGELKVNGTAKATYNATSGNQTDNGIGVTNELNFTASGELDNGFTWSYSMELDPASGGTANNDDTQIVLGMGDMGKLKFCVSECSNNKKYAWSADVYAVITDTSLEDGIVYPNGEDSYASIQYHTPELLFGTTASLAIGQQKSDGQSGNTTATSGDSAEFYSIVSKPLDGLTVSSSYMKVNNYSDGATEEQLEQGGAAAIKYNIDNFSFGYGKSYKSPQTTLGITISDIEYFENTGYSFGYAVNSDLSISFTSETSDKVQRTSTDFTHTSKVKSLQAAYSLGGATLSLARSEYDNRDYRQHPRLGTTENTETIVAISFNF
tara:strand:+ start:5984 stop:7006 length:1023 start_codon:yes stop_codon:yes gene_type:complete